MEKKTTKMGFKNKRNEERTFEKKMFELAKFLCREIKKLPKTNLEKNSKKN